MEIVMTEKWQMIDFAIKYGAKVTNDKGESVKTSTEYSDAVKCYTKFPYYYLSSAENQTLLFDGKSYDEWYGNMVFDFTNPTQP